MTGDMIDDLPSAVLQVAYAYGYPIEYEDAEKLADKVRGRIGDFTTHVLNALKDAGFTSSRAG